MICLHLKLSKQADTIFQNFPSFLDGFRFYKCEECGTILKARVTAIHIEKETEERNDAD